MEFLKASIADLITLLFSSLQNSEGSGPLPILPFPKTKILLSDSPKKLAETKIVARINVKKIKAKKRKKGF